MTTSKQKLARELNWTKAQILNAADLLRRTCWGIDAKRGVNFAEFSALLRLQKIAHKEGIKGNYLAPLPFEMTRLGKKHLKEEEQYKKEQAKNDVPF